MKKLGIVIVAVLATVCVLAQDRPRRGGKHQRGERAAMGERPMHGPGPMMQGLLKDKGADSTAVMDKIDEVAKLRAEQGRLSVRALVVLRDNLSPEQLEKARAFIMERGRERGRMRHGMGPGGERPTPPPDGSAPRDKPFEAAK